ncbi:MAG TPA: hypothetical protein VLV31_11425 [Candidatus Acidoferrales bacterium]|nr:hypothetical protein [Candidatus Acidoferrales bacterium]
MPNEITSVFTSLEAIFGMDYGTVGEVVVRKLYEKTSVPLHFSRNRSPTEYAEELEQILAKDQTFS